MGPLAWAGLGCDLIPVPRTPSQSQTPHSALFHSPETGYCATCWNVLVEVKGGDGAHTRLAFLQKLGDETWRVPAWGELYFEDEDEDVEKLIETYVWENKHSYSDEDEDETWRVPGGELYFQDGDENEMPTFEIHFQFNKLICFEISQFCFRLRYACQGAGPKQTPETQTMTFL